MRNMFKTTAALMLITLGSTSMIAGCMCGDSTEDEATCAQPKPGTIVTVNEYCAIVPADPVDPAIVREWKGQKIGFCCQGCVPKWAKMTDSEKDAAVASAVARGKLKT